MAIPIDKKDIAAAKQKLNQEIRKFMIETGKKFEVFFSDKLDTLCVGRKHHSPQGAYPYRETGSLQASVGYEVTSNNSINVGVVRDVRLDGKKRNPMIYGAELEYQMYRKMVQRAWEEFWPTIDHRILFKIGAKVTRELEFVQTKGKAFSTIPTVIELQDIGDFVATKPTMMGREIYQKTMFG
jgi:hypothetical protein